MQRLSAEIEDLKVRRLVEAARKEPVTVLAQTASLSR